jgi:hypothetical protein
MLIFLYLQNPYKKIIAIAERNHIMTSEGIAIYLPKTPEVLIKRVAKIKLDRFL